MAEMAFPNAGQADYSLVIPAYNESGYLTRTLDALAEASAEIARSKSLHPEIIVVDNNSSDDTAAIASRHSLAGSVLSVVFEPENQISRARNTGAAAANTGYLIFVDADTLVSATLLGAALDALQDGAVGGGARIAIDRKHRGGQFVTGLWNRFAAWAKYAAGCFVFCRRDAFEAVGGFSEEVYASEEIWLARALKKWARGSALKFVVLPDYVVTSGRKLEWLSSFAMFKQVLVILLFPFALKYRRFCGAWYQRPDKSV